MIVFIRIPHPKCVTFLLFFYHAYNYKPTEICPVFWWAYPPMGRQKMLIYCKIKCFLFFYFRIRPNYFRMVRFFITRDILIVLGLVATPPDVIYNISRLVTDIVVRYISDRPELHVITLYNLMLPYMQNYALKFTLEIGMFLSRIRHRAEREPSNGG